MNTFSFDWTVRLKASANVNLFILFSAPWPKLETLDPFLVHTAVRLVAIHEGFRKLWQTHLGGAWRETTERNTWPAIPEEQQHWVIRSALDAYVAHLYGLTRDQYRHVLMGFSHKSYPYVPDLCLDHFDECSEVGRDEFARVHDPYWDIPLDDRLPTPVFNFEGGAAGGNNGGEFALTSLRAIRRRRKE